MLKPIELHEHKVENEKESCNETKNLESDGQFLMVEALCPEIKRVSQKFEKAADRPNYENLIKPSSNIPSSSLLLDFIIKITRIANVILIFIDESIVSVRAWLYCKQDVKNVVRK